MELWKLAYYAPIGSAVVALAALTTAIVAWRTNVSSFRASFRPLIRVVPLVDSDTRGLVETRLLLKNYGKGPGFSAFLYEEDAVFSKKLPIGRISVVEPLGSGKTEATRLGRVEMKLEANHRLVMNSRYRLLYQDLAGAFHETEFRVTSTGFAVRFHGQKLKERIPGSARELAAVVTPEGPDELP